MALVRSFLALLALSLCLKFWAIDSTDEYDDVGLLLSVADNGLKASGFTPLAVRNAVGGYRGACLIYVAPAKPEGGDRDKFIAAFSAFPTNIYWYRGQLYRYRPFLVVLWDRFISRLSFVYTRTLVLRPVFQIAASTGCKLEEIQFINFELGLYDG